MQTFTATEAKNQLSLLMDTAQREPVSIEKNGRPYVVMIPANAFDAEVRKRVAKERIIRLAEEISEQAARNGMTPEILKAILAERD